MMSEIFYHSSYLFFAAGYEKAQENFLEKRFPAPVEL